MACRYKRAHDDDDDGLGITEVAVDVTCEILAGHIRGKVLGTHRADRFIHFVVVGVNVIRKVCDREVRGE